MNPRRTFPNYIVIGAAKCATTTIRTLLGRHPDVFMVRDETQFFNHDGVYARGLDWYASLFAEGADRPLRGEGSNGLTMQESFPRGFERLTANLPELKLIYIVREPLSRIESFWLELRSQHPDYVHPDFNRAVDVNRDWLTLPSNYVAQLEPYRDHYGDDAIHVVFYEDYRADPQRVLRGCFEFLGVDPDLYAGSTSARLNESSHKRVFLPALSRVRSIPGYRRVMRRVPHSLRNRVARAILSAKVRQRPQWRPETRAWVLDLLRDDLQLFLQRYGKSADFWNLELHDGYNASVEVLGAREAVDREDDRAQAGTGVPDGIRSMIQTGRGESDTTNDDAAEQA